MDQHLIFLLLGLANGAVFAALAMALVVTYRSSGVLNFATGTIALYGAYTYAFLRHGQLLVLIPNPFTGTTVDLGTNFGFWPATLMTLVISSLFGLLLYVLVFRPLRTAPAVAPAVASIGVMVVLTGLMSQRLGTTPVSVDAILPTKIWVLGSVRISSDRVWFAVTILAIAFVIAAAFRFTRFGLHTRAAAATEKGALVSGIAPDRVAALNWMISAAVAAIAGILIAPIVPLVPISYTLFIVPALAAAVLGRFQYLIPAVVGGLAIGMLQSEVTYLHSLYSWLPSSGLSELVPLVLILLVLVVRAKPLPSRGVILQRTLGRAPRPQRILMPTALGTAAGALALIVLTHNWRSAMVTSLIFAMICLSLVVVTGYAGQVSLAQLTLAGVAGFLLGTITTEWGVPFPIAPILAALGATVVGVVVGLPAIRVRGLFVAVVTLAMAYAIEAVWFHNSDYVPAEGKNITGPTLFGLDLRARVGTDYPRLSFCLLVLVVLVIVALGVAKLRTSRLGSAMLAVRANERSAAGAGINVVRVEDRLVRDRCVHRRARRGDARLQAGQRHLRLVRRPGRHRRLRDRVPGRHHVRVRWHPRRVARRQRHRLLRVVTVAEPGRLVRHDHRRRPRAHRRAQPRRHRRARARRTREDARAAGGRPGTRAGRSPPGRGRAGGTSRSGTPVVARRACRVRRCDRGRKRQHRRGRGHDRRAHRPERRGQDDPARRDQRVRAGVGVGQARGRELGRLPPHRRIRAGLGRTFQQIELYDDLTVRENVVAGLAARERRRASEDDLQRTLELLELTDLAELPAGELSQGRRQLVSIARALIGDPRVVLLDEPASGLDTAESEWLGERLRTIRDSGVTILLVDHDMHLVLNLCEQIHVLDFGRLIASGPPAAVKADRRVTEAYLGSTHAEQTTAAT